MIVEHCRRRFEEQAVGGLLGKGPAHRLGQGCHTLGQPCDFKVPALAHRRSGCRRDTWGAARSRDGVRGHVQRFSPRREPCRCQARSSDAQRPQPASLHAALVRAGRAPHAVHGKRGVPGEYGASMGGALPVLAKARRSSAGLRADPPYWRPL